jgi:hypothetical protein
VIAAAILPSLGLVPEIAVAAIPGDERVWVPQAADVWVRPLSLNTFSGGWCNLLCVRRSGVLSYTRTCSARSRCAASTMVTSALARIT